MAWVDGEHVDAAMEKHIEACEECRALAGEIRTVSTQLAAWSVEPASWTLSRPAIPRFQWRYVSMAGVIVIGLLAFSTLFGWFGSTQPAPATVSDDQSAFERDWAARPRVDVGTSADGAAVVVTAFVDWQCPTCTHLEYAPVIASYEAKAPGSVRYVPRDYPINAKCNPNIPADAPAHHPAACEAAAAVRMARDRGKADEFIGWIFANQSALTPERVKAEAASMLAVHDFDAAYAAELPRIQRDVADATRLHVQFAPTVFVNGVLVNEPGGGLPAPQKLDYAIQYELRRAGRR
jgi:protein-disulfide isomerase